MHSIYRQQIAFLNLTPLSFASFSCIKQLLFNTTTLHITWIQHTALIEKRKSHFFSFTATNHHICHHVSVSFTSHEFISLDTDARLLLLLQSYYHRHSHSSTHCSQLCVLCILNTGETLKCIFVLFPTFEH